VSNNHDIFDDLIKSQLDGFDANVSMTDWDAIAAKLPVAETKKGFAYWWLAGIAILVIGVTSYVALFQNADKQTAPNEVVLNNEATSPNQESVVKNNNIPTPNEAPSTKTVNEPNQPENLNTDLNSTTSNGVDTKTSSRSTTGTDNLPTNNVDNKPDETHTKGVEDSGFSTVNSDKASTDDVDPEKQTEADPKNIADVVDPGNKDETKVENIDSPNPDKKDNILPVKTKWEIGLSASPTWASKLISVNGANGWKVNPLFDQIASSMESGTISYQVEGKLNRYFNDHLYLGVGLNYNQVAEQVSYDYIVDYVVVVDPILRTVTNEADPRIHDEVSYNGRNVYHFVEVPVRIGYLQEIPNTKFQIRGETGLRYMALMDMSGKKVGVTYTDSLVNLKSSLNDYSRHNVGATATLGLMRSIGENTDFGATVTYNYALTSIRKRDEGITEKPYNFGLNFSLQHKIWRK
jgi:hypothetical protein